jgi:DNA-directed RNA polymerase specialized sigma24 family protein
VTCIEEFFNDHYDELKQIANICTGEKYGNDLVNDVAVSILEREDDKYTVMCERGELLWYVLRWIKICSFSKTTRFYYKYKKWTENVTFEYPMGAVGNMSDSYADMNHREQLQMIDALLDDLNWFEAEIFRVYYIHNHSINTLTNATGIGRKTIQESLKKAKEHIQKNKEKIQGAG